MLFVFFVVVIVVVGIVVCFVVVIFVVLVGIGVVVIVVVMCVNFILEIVNFNVVWRFDLELFIICVRVVVGIMLLFVKNDGSKI